MRSIFFLLIFAFTFAQAQDKMRGSSSMNPKGTPSTQNTATTTTPAPNGAVTWDPVVEMDGNVFTSYIYASSLMPVRAQDRDDYKGDKNGQIGIKVKPASSNTHLKLVIEAPEIMYAT